MPCPHCFAPDHPASACPIFAQVSATLAVTSNTEKERPAERIYSLLSKIPPAEITPSVRALLTELIAQLQNMQRDIENIHVSLDMEGL